MIVPPYCRIDTVYHNFCAYADKLKSVYGVSKSPFHAGSTEIRIPSHATDASSLFVMIRHLDGFYRLDHAVTATQKTILDEFGLSEGSVRNQAKEIGKTLQDRTDKD